LAKEILDGVQSKYGFNLPYPQIEEAEEARKSQSKLAQLAARIFPSAKSQKP
jgi:hypothetical protein